jgi:hypothetical protein
MPFIVPPGLLQKKKAAVKKETVKKAESLKRINNLATASVVSTTAGSIASSAAPTVAAAAAASTVVGSGLNRQAVGVALSRAGKVVRVGGLPGLGVGLGLTLIGKALENSAIKDYNNLVGSTPPDNKSTKSFPPRNYDYNLPPHKWSLPVRPHSVDGGNNGKVNVANASQNNHEGDFHRLRRGVIWHWSNGSDISATKEENGATVITSAAQLQAATKASDLKNEILKQGSGKENNYNYGFQFLWNPETISSSISRNMDVTPSSADRFRSVAGAFPGQETYQFQIMLDRVNDFAALRSMAGNTYANSMNHPKAVEVNANSPQVRESKYSKIPSNAVDYYPSGLGTVNLQKINDLMKFGTMADLEYLFKALNGNGANQGSGEWATLMLKKTANIGFLSPSLLGFRFGPNAQQQLSFVGWITNMSINHTFFTEDMIPLRTTVSFSCDAFAGSTVV